MTFKHVKFQDSVVMRSLEKVAREKGLVKEDDLVKTASAPKKVDLSPSSTLLVNLLKLSAGLREAGFDKYADELETKTLSYKQAQTLYETSKEKGEDLVDAAHPKGSHKLEDVDADEAVFETILDQHLKNLKMIEKTPTGKLASSYDILKAVKMVLADGDPSTGLTQPVINYIMSIFKLIDESLSSTWNSVTGLSQDGQLAYNRLKANFIKYMNNRTINNATIASLNSTIDEAIKGFSSRDASRFFYVSDEAEKIIYQLKSLKNYINDTVVDDHKALSKPEAPKETPLTKVYSQLNSVKDKITSWKAYRSISKSPEALKWINDELNALQDIFNRYKSTPESQQADAAIQMEKELNEEISDINTFENKWVKATSV